MWTSFVDKEIGYAVKQKEGVFALRRLHLLFIQRRVFVDEIQIYFIYFQSIRNYYWFFVRLLKPYNFTNIALSCWMHHFPFKHYSYVRLFFFLPLEIMDAWRKVTSYCSCANQNRLNSYIFSVKGSMFLRTWCQTQFLAGIPGTSQDHYSLGLQHWSAVEGRVDVFIFCACSTEGWKQCEEEELCKKRLECLEGIPLRLFFQLSDHLCALVKFISKPRRTLIVISPLRVQTECFGFF